MHLTVCCNCCNKKFSKRFLLLDHVRQHSNPECSNGGGSGRYESYGSGGSNNRNYRGNDYRDNRDNRNWSGNTAGSGNNRRDTNYHSGADYEQQQQWQNMDANQQQQWISWWQNFPPV
uniref:C2H2-type domain-containing protein n=1 Tax=Glossina pallidipes TaxID=7398 RepID=A0A1B0AE45_GLOPL